MYVLVAAHEIKKDLRAHRLSPVHRLRQQKPIEEYSRVRIAQHRPEVRQGIFLRHSTWGKSQKPSAVHRTSSYRSTFESATRKVSLLLTAAAAGAVCER